MITVDDNIDINITEAGAACFNKKSVVGALMR